MTSIVDERIGRAEPMSSVLSCIGGTFAHSRTKSTGGVCCPVAHVYLRIDSIYR